MIFDTLIPFLEIYPREMIKNSIRMFKSNTINGPKSGIINWRMSLNKGAFTRLNIIQMYWLYNMEKGYQKSYR